MDDRSKQEQVRQFLRDFYVYDTGIEFSDSGVYVTDEAVNKCKALFNATLSEILEEVETKVIGDDVKRKLEDDGYGEYTVCRMCDMIPSDDDERSCNCTVQNELRAKQRLAITEFRKVIENHIKETR